MNLTRRCRGWSVCVIMGAASGIIVAVCMPRGIVWGAEAQPFHYDAQGRRDPFEPLVSPTGELRTPHTGRGLAGTLRIEGILWDPKQPMALVNGEVHRAGDEVAGCRLVAIRGDGVLVDCGQGERTLIPVVVDEEGGAAEGGSVAQ